MALRHNSGRCGRRNGTVMVLAAVLMVVMMGFIALAIDVGYISTVQTEIDRAVEAGALAGAGALPDGVASAEEIAYEFAMLNRVGKQALDGNELTFQAGHWDDVQRAFTPGGNLPSAVRISASRVDQRPLFFSPVWGIETFDTRSSAIAMFQPRDIMVVLDYSASMNDDSELSSISTLGRSAVEDNLALIHSELGSPTYGTLNFQPGWMVIPGTPPSNADRPQIHVEYRYSDVYVTSTKAFDRVMIYNSGGASKTFNGSGTWNASENVYEQTLSYNGSSRIGRVRVRSGYNDSNHSSSNKYEESFYLYNTSDIRNAAKLAWQLNGVPYPYPSGSWDKYIDHCTSSSNGNAQAGYRYRFGYMNFIDYLLYSQPSYSQTPDLWMTSEQPITAVKNAVDVFLGFMQEMNTSDRVGLAIYNSSSGWGQLEQELTLDYGVVSTISRHRQAGHYHSMTNIAAGLDTARIQLRDEARTGALKMIVLMTDGVPTFPGSSSYSRALAIDAAEACATAGYPVVTISLGAGADTSLMQQIADMTGGIHFQVPGGRPVAEVEEDLRDTFRRIAEERPLKLVYANR